MSISYVNFSVAQGADFSAVVRVASGSGGPIDLTSASLSGMVRTNFNTQTPAAVFTTTMIDAPNGTFRFSLTPAQTAGLDQRKYFYDVIAVEGPNTYRLVEGSLFLRPWVTR